MSDIPVAWVHSAVVQALLSAGTRCAPQDLFKALGLPLPPLPPPPPPASAVEDDDEDEDEDEDGDPNNTYRPRLTAHEAAWVHKALLQPAAEGAEPPHVTARQLVRALESTSWAPGDHAWRVDKVLETSLKLMNPTLPTWTQLRAYVRTARYHPLHTYYGDRGADGWPVRYGADAAEQDDDNDDGSRPVHGHNTAAARQASERDVLHRLCFRLHDVEIWGWTASDLLHDLAAYPVDWTPVVAALELRVKKPGPTGAPWPVKVARKALMRALDQGVTGYELGVALRQAGHPLLCDLVEWRLNRNPLAYKPVEIARRYASWQGNEGAGGQVLAAASPGSASAFFQRLVSELLRLFRLFLNVITVYLGLQPPPDPARRAAITPDPPTSAAPTLHPPTPAPAPAPDMPAPSTVAPSADAPSPGGVPAPAPDALTALIDRLPNEVLALIFEHVPIHLLVRLRRVCRRWRAVIAMMARDDARHAWPCGAVDLAGIAQHPSAQPFRRLVEHYAYSEEVYLRGFSLSCTCGRHLPWYLATAMLEVASTGPTAEAAAARAARVSAQGRVPYSERHDAPAPLTRWKQLAPLRRAALALTQACAGLDSQAPTGAWLTSRWGWLPWLTWLHAKTIRPTTEAELMNLVQDLARPPRRVEDLDGHHDILELLADPDYAASVYTGFGFAGSDAAPASPPAPTAASVAHWQESWRRPIPPSAILSSFQAIFPEFQPRNAPQDTSRWLYRRWQICRALAEANLTRHLLHVAGPRATLLEHERRHLQSLTGQLEALDKVEAAFKEHCTLSVTYCRYDYGAHAHEQELMERRSFFVHFVGLSRVGGGHLIGASTLVALDYASTER